jgi:hypothetical protein
VLVKSPLEIEVRSTAEGGDRRVIVDDSDLLVFTPLQMKADNGPVVLTGEVQGSSRFLVDNEVGSS